MHKPHILGSPTLPLALEVEGVQIIVKGGNNTVAGPLTVVVRNASESQEEISASNASTY